MNRERIESAGDEAQDEELIASSQRARRLDRRLADRLGRSAPRGADVGAGYLDGLARRPRLSTAAELELVRAAQAGDVDARRELIEAFLPAIGALARHYRSGVVDRLDLLQEGVVGLLRALRRYDPDRGTPFWPYAAWWVRQAMQRLVAELTRPVVLSDQALRQLARVRDAYNDLQRERGREPTADELAAATGLRREAVESLLVAGAPPASMHEPGGGEEVSRLEDRLADPASEGDYEAVLDRVAGEQLAGLLGVLTDRERDVLAKRHGLETREMTMKEVGAELGVSAERVRQIEKRALGKLAAASAG